MPTDLPPNTATLLECCKCKYQAFRVSWNWTPTHGIDPCWMLECLNCHVFAWLDPNGIPNPESIHGAIVNLPIPGGGRADLHPVLRVAAVCPDRG